MKGKWPKDKIDHKDGNRSNNKIDNLREATHAQNQHNTGLRKTNTTGYKGVCFDKESRKYSANICINGKQVKLGRFLLTESANKAYIKASNAYQKEYAVHKRL